MGLTLKYMSWVGPWIFKVKYRICFISAKYDPIATKQKSGHMDCTGSPICYHRVFELGHDLDLEFSRTNMDFAIFQTIKNSKITYRLKLRPPMPPSVFTWPWPWSWIFKVRHGLCFISTKNVPNGTKKPNANTLGLKCDQWKSPDCQETNSKRIDSTVGVKWDQWDWPWPCQLMCTMSLYAHACTCAYMKEHYFQRKLPNELQQLFAMIIL